MEEFIAFTLNNKYSFVARVHDIDRLLGSHSSKPVSSNIPRSDNGWKYIFLKYTARPDRWIKSETKFGLSIPMLDKIATNDEPIRRQ